MEENMRAIVVGRHSGEIPGVEIMERRDIQFPTTGTECLQYLESLIEAAQRERAALIFQVLPGQAWAALHVILHERFMWNSHPDEEFPRVGVVINVPGERPSGVVMETTLEHGMDAMIVGSFLKKVNPRANVETFGPTGVRVTLDPALRFEFSHIEWLC